ncbi:MAG: serine/threonine protein kinase [Candidatus Wallbacteria bacterium]|nr:serine/threonine protein kinase [Candidatus Wallbacteria bacterium]
MKSVLGELGRYRLIERIGAGGMGVVTRAHDPKLNRDVAIKAIAEGGKTPPGVAERLRREAMMLARVSHPNVVRVFDVGQPPETLYYVMELLPGTSLESRLAAEPGPSRFDAKEFLELFTPLSDALAAAHAAGVLHRDIKPANIMVGVPDRGPVLTDFGLAWVPDQARLTREGVVVGTLRYMAPEQAAGSAPSPLCDLYGLGVCMFEYATGRKPFMELTGPMLILARPRQQLPPLACVAPHVPDSLARVIDHCVKLDPAERFASARHLHRALEHAARELGLDALTVPARKAAPAKALVKSARAGSPHPVLRQALRGAALAVVVASLSLQFAYLRPRSAVVPSVVGHGTAGPVRPGAAFARDTKPGAPDTLRLTGPGERGNCVALAVLGDRLLAMWSAPDARLRVRLGSLPGLNWTTPPASGQLRLDTESAVAAVGHSGRFHLLYMDRDSQKQARLNATSTGPDAASWTSPVALGPASGTAATPVLACAASGLPSDDLLAAWEGPRGSTPRVAWGDARSCAWQPGSPFSSAGSHGRLAAALTRDGAGLLVLEQSNPLRGLVDLYASRCEGRNRPWPPFSVLPVNSSGYDRQFPVTVPLDGGGVFLQMEEVQLPAHPLLLAESTDEGCSFRAVGVITHPYCKDDKTALAALGRRVWSAWRFPMPDRLVWSTSRDRGRSWSRPAVLGRLPRHHAQPVLTALPAGDARILWVNEEGQVHLTRLP